MGFTDQEKKDYGYRGSEPSANDAVEEANYRYEQMAREEMAAGREIPIVDIPYDILGDTARVSVEEGDRLLRQARRHSFMLSARGRLNWDRIFGKREVVHVEKD